MVRDESEDSPLVTTADRAEELIKLVSLDVRNPFKADSRGLFTPRGQAPPGAAPTAITEGAGLDRLWDVGVKGKGRPANTDDKEAELGLLAEAVLEVAEKRSLRKGAEVGANVSLDAGVAPGTDMA